MSNIVDPTRVIEIIDLLRGLDAKNAVVVTINNRTDKTLIFSGFDEESGSFATQPEPEIPPGGEDVFGWVERSGSIFTGAAGTVTYAVGDDQTTWSCHFSNPTAGENNCESQVRGAEANLYRKLDVPGAGDQAQMSFTLRKIGLQPGGDDDDPDTDLASSCLITVTNRSDSVLTLVDQGHDHGEFVTFPGVELQPGDSDTFASVETPGSEVKGCQGFLVYEVGAAGTCVWTVEWNNPEQEDNSTVSVLDGLDASRFSALDQIGTGEENVPVVFTIAGAGGGGGGGGGEDRDPFVTPVEADEPTLRFGDQSVDGWVEYLQELLNAWQVGPVTVDGDFGEATRQAVVRFQSTRQPPLMVDGVVGNQTWASLREEDPRPPSTDGREPHTFVEQGPEARWLTEDNAVQYDPAQDTLFVIAVSTGDTPIASSQFEARVFVTAPSGAEVDFDVPGQTADGGTAGQGDQLFFATTGLKQQGGAGIYSIRAFLPQELGGDATSRTLEVD